MRGARRATHRDHRAAPGRASFDQLSRIVAAMGGRFVIDDPSARPRGWAEEAHETRLFGESRLVTWLPFHARDFDRSMSEGVSEIRALTLRKPDDTEGRPSEQALMVAVVDRSFRA